MENTLRPATPGAMIDALLEEKGLEIDEQFLAESLQIAPELLAELLEGRAAVTPDLALRLGRCFNNRPELWMKLQHLIDMWEILHRDTTAYAHLRPLPPSVARSE